MKKTAVILLSGGLDSTTCVAIAKAQGFDPYGLTINYGQKHIFEIKSAKSIANYYNIKITLLLILIWHTLEALHLPQTI